MAIIIGGSSSTGSSLLQTILNRHSRIYCGPETSLFAKKELYTSWGKNKNRILASGWYGLRNPSWFLLNGTHLFDNSGIWSLKDIRKTIIESGSFQEFAENYFAKYLNHYTKDLWIEKTPTNSINFNLFLTTFSDSKVIHMTRNPYDTITSLVRRGYSPFFSTGLYLCNSASGINARENQNYIQIRYEDLIANPILELEKLCEKLGVKFEKQMLNFENQGLDMKNEIEGWNYNANEPIGGKSVGSFNLLDDNIKEEIKSLVSSMILQGNHQRKENSIKEICGILGYEYLTANHKIRYKHKIDKFLDMIKRTARMFPSNIFNYPVTFIN